MHLLADADEPTWVSEYDGGSAVDGPLSKQYLFALYWSLTTMSTVGYGDITPANDRERAFATGSLVVGALTFAFINRVATASARSIRWRRGSECSHSDIAPRIHSVSLGWCSVSFRLRRRAPNSAMREIDVISGTGGAR